MKKAFVGVSEYDRFGPWIDEVKQVEDVPRLYRSYPIDFSVESLVLKVPRDITRRNATPDMDLYDHLIMLGQERLTVLSRRAGKTSRAAGSAATSDSGKGYDIVVIQCSDVVAIRNALNLLDGRLTVSTSEGTPIAVSYNGAAGDVVGRFVSALREAACVTPASPLGSALLAAGGPLARPAVVPGHGHVDTFLASAFLEAHSANPHLAAWAAHASRRLTPEAAGVQGTVERMKHALSPMTLHGALFAADDAALEVFGRHSWLIRGRNAVYSTSHLVIPFGAPDHLDLAPHPLYPDVIVATIGAGKWRGKLPVPRESVAEQLLSEAASKSR
jgi:hypothetical protein